MSRVHTLNYEPREATGPVRQCIEDYPDEAVLVSLAAGFGLGLVIGGLLAGSSSSHGWRQRHVATGLGERLMASIEKVLPDSVSSSLGMHK